MITLIKKNLLLILILICAFVSLMVLSFFNGNYYCFQNKCGLYFWRSHGHDALWHMAVASISFTKFPFIMPTYSGELLNGYNYLLDVLLFLLQKINIPVLFAYFKILPIVWFIIFTYLLIKLARKIKSNKVLVSLLLFFMYFTGSFSYLFTLLKDRTIWGSSGLLFHFNETMMLNLQFGVSLVPLTMILITIKNKTYDKKSIVIISLMTFILFGLKFYGGVVALLLLIPYLAIGVINKKKNVFVFGITLLLSSLLAIFLFYNPVNSLRNNSIFIFSPFTSVHHITENPDLFFMEKLTNFRYAQTTKGTNIKLLLIEGFNLIVFLFFYLGVRFFGVIYLIVKLIKKKATNFDISVTVALFGSIAITTFFVQRGEWTNIYQFFYYSVFLSTFYLAELANKLIFSKRLIIKSLLIIIVLLAIPTTIDLFKTSLQFPGLTYLPQGELEALLVLKRQQPGIVFSPLYDKTIGQNINQPKPLYAWEDTAYVSAFSGKQHYLSDIWMEQITGISYQKRLGLVKKNDCRILRDIHYIYYNNEFKIARSLFDCPNKLEFLWGNRTSTIYRVTK